MIIFFSSLMSIFYYFGVMPLIVRGFAYVFAKFMKISGAESLSAASNIFVGIESALTIKPHLKDMTRSELCTVLTAGMATVSSNVLAVYIFGSSGFLVGGQRVAGSSILPTRRRPQSHRSPKGGQEIPKYPTRQSGRGQLVKGIRH